MTKVFTIVGKSNTSDYIHEYTEYQDVATFGEPQSQQVKGLKYYERDSDGLRANRLSDTEFQIVSTGEHVTVRS